MKTLFLGLTLLASSWCFAGDDFKIINYIENDLKYDHIIYYCTYNATSEEKHIFLEDFSVTVESYKHCGGAKLGSFEDEEKFLTYVLNNFPLTSSSKAEVYGKLQDLFLDE